VWLALGLFILCVGNRPPKVLDELFNSEMFPIRFKSLRDYDADEGTVKLVDGIVFLGLS
jgi:hypothetical protein